MFERELVEESLDMCFPHLRKGQVMGKGETKGEEGQASRHGSLGEQVASSLGRQELPSSCNGEGAIEEPCRDEDPPARA